MRLKKNYPLSKLTTMGVGGPARFLVRVKNKTELLEALEWAKEQAKPVLVLGGGSNVVVSDRGFDGLVIIITIKGWQVIKQTQQAVWLKAGAGEILDELVKRAVANNWWGLENLSFIPGTLAGLVIQNGGAYGREIGELVERVEVYDTVTGRFQVMSRQDCNFAYRQSVFNGQLKGRYIILSITLKLARQGKANIDYRDLELYFKQRRIKRPSLKQVRRAVIKIRKNKLPDWQKIGSAGSFFKNLFLDEHSYNCLLNNLKANFGQQPADQLEQFRQRFAGQHWVKVPTAWLLDICGLKGLKVGGAAIYNKQPLVIVNSRGKATAQEVMRLFRKVRRQVFKLTGMVVEPEPQLVGFSERELVKYFLLD